MSGFNGINNFGNLTANGKQLKFEDIDKNGDKKIDTEEYQALLEQVQLDNLDISVADKNGDKEISEDEFAVWEQKILMQNAVNDLSRQISADFAGKPDCITQVASELKDLIDNFASGYKDDVSGMADAFKKVLPQKYNIIKTAVLVNDPGTIKSKVLDEIYNDLIQGGASRNGVQMSQNAARAIAKTLEAEADNFIKSYTGTNLAVDLKTHLTEYMNKSDYEKLSSDYLTLNSKVASANVGTLVDSGELKLLKEYVTDFLQAAVDKGVVLNLGGKNIASTSAITSALNGYSDWESLKADLDKAMANISHSALSETIVAQTRAADIAAEDANFTSIKGEAYQVNAGLIDYSGIEGYFNGGRIHERGKGWSGSKNKAYDEGEKLLQSETLKKQLKTQITQMLQKQGVEFSKVENLFENVYSQSAIEVLNSDGMITGRGARGLSRKGHAYINIKDLVDKFITTFNTNIAKAVDEMNASSTDMDLMDTDFTQAGKDASGNPIKDPESGEDLSQLYASGKTIKVRKHGPDYFVPIAEQMVERMRSQMMAKAQAMCNANGVKFDNSVFTTMFNNAKSIAVNAAVAGVDSDGKSFGGVALSSGGAAGIGAVAALGTGAVAASSAGVTLGLTTVTGAIAEAAAFTGPVGWIVGGVAATISAVALIGKGNHSESFFNARQLLDTFTQQFKADYTNWVETEKNTNNA